MFLLKRITKKKQIRVKRIKLPGEIMEVLAPMPLFQQDHTDHSRQGRASFFSSAPNLPCLVLFFHIT